jgi:HK97 family phage major capsid protein
MPTISLIPSHQRAILKRLQPELSEFLHTTESMWDVLASSDAASLHDRAEYCLDAADGLIETMRAEKRDPTEDENTTLEALRALASRLKMRANALQDARIPEIIAPRMTTPDPLPASATRSHGLASDNYFGVAASTSVARAHPSLRELAQDGLTFGGLVRSLVGGGKTNLEKRALAEGADASGGVTVPDILLREFLDRLRAAIVCVRAGARTVLLESDKNTIARLVSDPVVQWRAENALVAESDPTFDSVLFQPKWCGAIVRCSRELLMDSLNIESALTSAFVSALALEIDRVALLGSGTAPEPRGIFNTVGIGAVPITTALKHTDLLTALGVVAQANAGPSTGVVLSPTNYYKLAQSIGTDGHFLVSPAAIPPLFMTSSMPNSSAIVGNFNECLFGVRTEIRVELLREAFVTNFQYAFIGWTRFDVGLAHPASFAKITGIV